jgi:hypothetical protein
MLHAFDRKKQSIFCLEVKALNDFSEEIILAANVLSVIHWLACSEIGCPQGASAALGKIIGLLKQAGLN